MHNNISRTLFRHAAKMTYITSALRLHGHTAKQDKKQPLLLGVVEIAIATHKTLIADLGIITWILFML